MRRRRGIAGRIEHGAAADGDDVGVTADAAVVDRAVDRVDVPRVVLHRLAAGHDDDRAGKAEDGAVALAVLLDLCDEIRMMAAHAVVDDEDQAGRADIR